MQAFAFEEVAEALYGGAEAMEAWKQSGVLEVDGTQLGYDVRILEFTVQGKGFGLTSNELSNARNTLEALAANQGLHFK